MHKQVFLLHEIKSFFRVKLFFWLPVGDLKETPGETDTKIIFFVARMILNTLFD